MDRPQSPCPGMSRRRFLSSGACAGCAAGAALLAPAGLSFNVDGVRLSEDLTPSILRGTPLGEAIRHSLEKYLEDAPEALAEVPYLTTLLGDPAMRIIR